MDGNTYSAGEIAENRVGIADVYTAAEVELPDDPKCTLHLPADLITVESEAFAGISVDVVYVPATVTSIADDAFQLGTFFVFEQGSSLIDWAVNRGYPTIVLTEEQD